MELASCNLKEYISSRHLALVNTLPLPNINPKRIVNTDPIQIVNGLREVLKISIQIGHGLTYIHSRGQVHRDLKPPNGNNSSNALTSIVLGLSGNIWKIADFGSTVAGTSKRLQRTDRSRGTSGYRAPELLRDPPNAGFNNKVDIWSFGCIIWALITGEHVFRDDWDTRDYEQSAEIKTLAQVRYTPGTNLDARMVELADLVLSMLRKNWQDRPAATAILEMLETILEESNKWLKTSGYENSLATI